MHATTDLRDVGAIAIKILKLEKNYGEIVFICKRGSEFEKIAENLFAEGLTQIRLLSL
jgi:hypothetical protein